MDFSEIWSLSDKRRVTNEEQSRIPLQPIVFCYGKYLSRLYVGFFLEGGGPIFFFPRCFAFVDSLKSDLVRAPLLV